MQGIEMLLERIAFEDDDGWDEDAEKESEALNRSFCGGKSCGLLIPSFGVNNSSFGESIVFCGGS